MHHARFHRVAFAMLAMSPLAAAADASFFVEAGAVRVRADSFQTGDPTFSRTPAFSDTVPGLVLGSNFHLGPAPLRFSLFKSGSAEEHLGFALPPNIGINVESSLETYGATLSLTPSWQLADAWVADAGIGAVYLHRKVTSQVATGNHSDNALAAIASAGLSYRFAPTMSSRFGMELSKDHASATVGLHFDF